MGIAEEIKKMKMVTVYEDGRVEENKNQGDLFIWFSRHVQTKMHAEAVFAGIPTVMIDGSKVSFVPIVPSFVITPEEVSKFRNTGYEEDRSGERW